MNEKRKKNDNCKNINLTNNTPILISNPDKENINITLNYKDEKGRKLTFANLSVNNNSKGHSIQNLNHISKTNQSVNNLFNVNVLNIGGFNKVSNPSVRNSEIDSKEQSDNMNNLKSIIEITKTNEHDNPNIKKDYYNRKKFEIIQSNNESKKNYKFLSSSSIVKTISNKMKLQEFYINNNKKNKLLKHQNNEINTTKYNFVTFLPKSLLIQFSRLPNLYFLATAIIQSIPIISPLSSVTAIFPLIIVLGVSMLRELIEDLTRLTYDRLNNNEEIIVYREGKFIKTISSSLKLGEFIIVLENKQIPADMILIDSNLNEGMAYVETSSLDGEKNLKPKIANNNLCGILKNLLNPNLKPFETNIFNEMEIEGFCQCDYPNSDLHKLDGTLFVKINIKNYAYNEIKFPISERQMLLKGSILKNTNWIAGFVLYTGMNNKIILNSKKPRTKMSLIEKKMNKYLVGIFILLILLCLTSSILHSQKYHQYKAYYKNFILLKRSHRLESLLNFFTYFLLLNTLIPISLIITIETVKIIQGFFISWDVEMYSKIRYKFAKAKTVSINEELGNVNYIFSDKTGTLTSNKMEFKYCIIQGRCYEYDKNLKKKPLDILNSIPEIKKVKKKKFSIIKFPPNYFSEIINELNIRNNHSNGTSKRKYIKKKNENIELSIINEFWTAISITHECVSTKIGEYSGVSPDDVELVKTAHEQGYSYIQCSNNIREIRIGDIIQSFTVLNILNFSSERKRMSIIIKDKNGIIKLYCKGADSEIIKRMNKNNKDNFYSNFTLKCVDKLSCKGFRSLLIAYKIIDEDDYDKWNKELKNSEMNLVKKDKLVDKCYDEMERNLELIGATIVEDKLQDQVPETIKDLRMAGIKIWVLTGDKVDTAENIALSCNLISRNQKIFKIFIEPGNTERSRYNVNPEVEKFFREYKDFLCGKKTKKISNSNVRNHNLMFNNSNSNINLINSKFINSQNSNNIINQINSLKNQNKNYNNVNDGSSSHNIRSMNGSSIISNKSGLNQSNLSSNISCKCMILSKNKNHSKISNSSIPQIDSLPFSIIIEGPVLSSILNNQKRTKSFLKIALKASTVVCCRVSPLQKSKVIKEVKKFDNNAITLAIGDGGNDVSMIMEAHLGIGIYGEEGMRAVQASDFAIGEFKFLRRLLFFHGRNNNNRISKMILYFFYKNFVFSIVQFVYAFFCIGSGQTIIDDWFITCYNLIFTALPVGVQAVSDFDVLENDNEIIKKFMPLLYQETRDIYPIFNLKAFILSLSKGFISAFLIFYIVCFCDLGSEINSRGDYGTLWYMSLKTYTNIILSVNMTLFINMRYITFLFPLIMGITSFLLYIIFLVLVEHLTMFNSCATIFQTLSCLKFYVSCFLVSSMIVLGDYMVNSVDINFSLSLSSNLIRTIIDKNCDINDLLDEFVIARQKCSDIFQINHLQKKAFSKVSLFSSKINNYNEYIDFDNSHENAIKKSKSSQMKKKKNSNNMEINKNFETVLEPKKKSNAENSINEEFKKDNLFVPNENWMSSSKLILDANKKLEIPHFQLNS